MALVLGQSERIRPRGLETWTQAKAQWFHVAGYKVFAEAVKAYHEAECRVRIQVAPARTTKSFSAAMDPLAYCLHPTDPPCDTVGWVVGPTYRTNKEFEYLFDVLVNRKVAHPGLLPPKENFERAVCNQSSGDMEIRFVKQEENGRKYRTRIVGLTSENEKVLQGEQVTFAVLSEAAEHPGHIFDKYLSSRSWRTTLPTTPKARAMKWLKEGLIDAGRTDPAMGIADFEYPPEANPLYDWEARRQAEARALAKARKLIGPHATAADDPLFAEQFLGRWVQYTGRVLPFSRVGNGCSEAEVAKILRQCKVHVSTDYGYDDPAVALFWAVRPDGILVLFDEVYERKLTTAEFVERIESRLLQNGVKAERVCGDPSRPEVERVLQEAGLRVYPIDKNAQRDRAAGYRRLQDLLVAGPVEGYPGIFVSERCQNTMDEWEQLTFKENFQNEYATNAIAGEDHSTDAARYYVMSRPRPIFGQPQSPDAEIRKYVAELKKKRQRTTRYDWVTGKRYAAG